MPQLESSPHSLQVEKACVQQQGPSTAKEKLRQPFTFRALLLCSVKKLGTKGNK